MVVGQGGVLYVDLPHNAHLGLLPAADGDLGEGLGDALEVVPHLPLGKGLALLEELCQRQGPLLHQGVAGPLLDLIGLDLVFQKHQQVPVGQGGDGLAQQGQGDLKPGVALQPRKVHRDNGDEVQAVFLQGLAQQVDVVGGPAATAGLGHDEGHLVQVVLAAVQGVHQLADGQQGRVAGVVVHVLQALVYDLSPGGAQKLDVVPVALQHVFDELEVDRRHVGGQNGVVFFHLPGKFHPVGVVGHREHSPFPSFPAGEDAQGHAWGVPSCFLARKQAKNFSVAGRGTLGKHPLRRLRRHLPLWGRQVSAPPQGELSRQSRD